MPIERKTGLFYELMIRGNWDPQNGELGRVMTYQLQTGSALVDTDAEGKQTLAAPYAPDPAVDLTREQAVAFLDAKFAGFLDQLAGEQARATKAEADIAARDAEIENLKSTINAVHAALAPVEVK